MPYAVRRSYLRARRAVIRVRDTGVGIAPEMLPRVFEVFSQADRSLHRSSGGLGLGLPGVRRIMDEFQIDSALGRGTTVRVKKWKL